MREARKAKALTSIVCAKAVGVSQPAWNMWEMGVRLPKIELLTEVCDLLGVTPNHLLGYDTSAPSSGDITHGTNSPIIKVNGNHNTIAPPPSSTSSSPSTPKKRKAKK